MLDSLVPRAILLPTGQLDPTESHRCHANTRTLSTREDSKHVHFDDGDPTPCILAPLLRHRDTTEDLTEIQGAVHEDHRKTSNLRPLPHEGTWNPEREQVAVHDSCELLFLRDTVLFFKPSSVSIHSFPELSKDFIQ